MKKHFLYYITIILFTAAACQKDAKLPTSRQESYLMVYNGSADFYNLNSWVLVNNEVYSDRSYNDNGAGLVGAFNFSRYLTIDTGLFRIAFTDTASVPEKAAKITETIFRFEDRKHYTLYLTDSLGYANILCTPDDVVKNPARVKIRLINLSPDAGKVFLRLDTTDITAVKDVQYRQITPYTEIDPSTRASIRIFRTDESTGEPIMLSRKSFALDAGKCYTMILRGYIKSPDGDINKTIDLSTITNF